MSARRGDWYHLLGFMLTSPGTERQRDIYVNNTCLDCSLVVNLPAMKGLPLHTFMSPSFPLRRAFTLIELLTAIAIIAVLSALGLSGFSRARTIANQSKCSANLHQIGLGIANYVNENDGFLPGPIYKSFAGWFSTNTTITGLLPCFIAPYMGVPLPTGSGAGYSSQFVCPTWLSLVPRAGAGTQANWTDRCYVVQIAHMVDGVNTATFGVMPGGPASWGGNTPQRLVALPQPSTTWMITELDASGNFGSTAAVATPVHKTIRNTLFFDFHLEAVSTKP